MAERRLPAGRAPHDTINGFRVGSMAGALCGGLVTAVVGVSLAWLIFAGAALGGAVGYWSEKRKQRLP